MGAQGPLALCNSGFIPKLMMFLLICFIADVTRGARKPRVSLSQLFSSWLCHKCTQQWMGKKMSQACPKARVLVAGGCLLYLMGAGRSKPKAGGALGLLGWYGSPVWFLHLLSALLCLQPAEAHCGTPVLARGGLQDGCGLAQQRQN